MDDHGNSAAEATALALGSTLQGTIDPSGDNDYFSFEVIEGEWYFASIYPDPSQSDPLELIGIEYSDPDFSAPHLEETNDGQVGAHLLFQAGATGTAYLDVDGYPGTIEPYPGATLSDIGAYTITVDVAPRLPELNLYPGVYFPEAASGFPLTPGQTITLDGEVSNFGIVPAQDVRVDFFLSDDLDFDEGDLVFASVTLAEVLPKPNEGSSGQYFLTPTLPLEAMDGMYFGMVIDPEDTVLELSETLDPVEQLESDVQVFVYDVPLVVGPLPIMGTDTADTLIGGSRDEDISGLGGGDLLDGRDGRDTLRGGDGDDILIGGTGSDDFFGGAGNDQLYGEALPDPEKEQPQTHNTAALLGKTDIANFTGQRVEYEILAEIDLDASHTPGGPFPVTGNLLVSDLRAGAPDGEDALFGIDYLRFGDLGAEVDGISYDGLFTYGTEGNDAVVSWYSADRLSSGAGLDLIYAGGGNDTVEAGRQADLIYAGDGNDTVSGDEGADTLFGGAGDDLLFGGQGVDVLYGGDGRDRLDGGTGIDLMYGGDGADIFAMSSDDRIDQVRDFQAGVDRLDLSALGSIGMGDLVIADVGSWVEVSFSGAEGARAIRLFGAVSAADLGRESFLFEGDDPDAPFDPVLPVEGTDGDDTLAGTEAADTISGLGGDDSLAGLGGDDEIDGGAGSDTLEGGAGDDLLTGGVWADVLYGGADDDTLDGGSGADVLYGGDGADRLDGGTGIDVLYGGAGADVFAYSSDTRYDRVQDFEDGIDRIDMTGFGTVDFADIAVADYGAWVALTYDAGGVVHGMYLRGPGLTSADLDASDFILS